MLYQSLQAGKKVYIFKRSNYLWHFDIFDYIQLFDTPSELAALINESAHEFFGYNDVNKIPLFYSRFNVLEFQKALIKVSTMA